MTTPVRSGGGLGRTLPVPRRFTVDEYYRMAEAGILRPDERVELLCGEIFTMSPIGSRHARCVRFLTHWFITRLAGLALVSVQSPIRLDNGSEPEPDIALLRLRPDEYAGSHPGPRDVLLLIEVADTSLAYDLDKKLKVYAEAAIPEVWIADLGGDRVLVHREPRDGVYQQVVIVERGGMLSPLAFPELTLPVDELLGPVSPHL